MHQSTFFTQAKQIFEVSLHAYSHLPPFTIIYILFIPKSKPISMTVSYRIKLCYLECDPEIMSNSSWEFSNAEQTLCTLGI